jgi:hypothetical protein
MKAGDSDDVSGWRLFALSMDGLENFFLERHQNWKCLEEEVTIYLHVARGQEGREYFLGHFKACNFFWTDPDLAGIDA